MTPRTLPHLLAVIVAVLAAAGLYGYAFSAELPVGGLRGRLIASDTKQPLAGITLVIRPGVPKDGMDTLDAKTDKDGYFVVPRRPAGNYELTPHTSAYKSRSVKTAVLEGKVATADLKLDPGSPYLNLNIHQHAFLPGDNPRVAVNGFRQGEQVKIRILTVDAETMLHEDSSKLRELLTPISTSTARGASLLHGGKIQLLRTIEHRIAKRDAEGVFYDFEHLGTLSPGIYLLQAEGDGNSAVGWLMVTDLALITKSAEGQARLFTVDLRTGVPVPAARVVVYQQRNVLKELRTDANGRAEFNTNYANSDGISAIARRGESVAFMNFRPFGSAWYGEDGKPEQYRVFTYTERPVYRPGHHVMFKGVVRKLEREGYSIPAPRTVGIEVKDQQETAIYRGQASMNTHGSFAGEFDLSSAAAAGSYTITAKLGDEEHSEMFVVASYRKPEWRVEVTSPKKSYVRGDQVDATVSAQYYYGAPVSNARVEYTIVRSQYWSYGDEDSEYLYGEMDHSEGIYGEVVENGEARTDAEGIAHIRFSSKAGDPTEVSDFEYTVQATVIDLSERTASGDLTVRVSAGQYRLEATPSRYMAPPGEQVTIAAKLQDLDQKPVPNVPVEVKATLYLWDRSGSHEKVLAASTVSTDAKGQLSFPVTLSDTGSVTVRLSARDPRGNRVEATTDIWVTSYEGGDYGGTLPSISMVPDRKEYRIGDTAQILINVEHPGATALVAAESVRVLELKQVRLAKKSTVVHFPIREGYDPNFFVTACFVRDREFITNQVLIRVNPENHRLNVTIESDRADYHPGDTATFKIRTTTAAGGKPVPAEVSFGVVDEAVYAIQEEPSRGLWEAFYPRRENQVLTEFSFPQIYLGDADKDGPQIAVRKKFPDTAFWDPFVRTDSSGRATVRVTLPDSLTSWRATAVAETDRTQIGKKTLNVRVAKELTLRLQTPRSITEGDTLNVSAIAHNYTKSAQDVPIELAVRGVELLGKARQTVHLAPEEAKRVDWEIKATTPGDAVFTATARAGAFTDGLELTVPVRAFARQDVDYRSGAVTETEVTEELELDPAAARGTLEIRTSPSLAGTILGSLDYLATFPYGCVEQTMSGFLPDVVLSQSLRDLHLDRPKLAKSLPEMTTAGLLRLYGMQNESGGWGWWQYDQPDAWMTAYVMFGLDLAHRNGMELNPRVRENGLSALKQIAEEEKLRPDDAMFVAYVLALNGANPEASKLLQRFEKQVGKLQRRSQGYRILALVTLGGSQNREQATAAMDYLWSVVEEAGGQYHWSEPRGKQWTHVPQDVESTALVLKAALALDANDSRLPGIVRWLLVRRRGGHWVSTRDTAWILLALTDYLRLSGELRPDYQLTVALNDRELRSETIRPTDALREEEVIRIPLSELKGQNRVRIRREGASGSLYYSVRLTQEIRTATFAPESTVPGLSLKREYFVLTNGRDANGQIVTLPSAKPVTRFRVGDRILVRLTITSSQALEYLMIEDPLPAGCEVQDRGEIPFPEWDYWWSNMEVRDDRVAFFTRDYGAEEKQAVLEYYLRPEHSGKIQSLPTVLEDMYNPAVRATTAESRLEIGR
ncbi:MAG: alpha-2-macroglobulin domain protein [Armatimonadetes bacterium]|nr:alpha-2-macroglobulin domain protein [Armatimonadota bacterium]